MGGRSFNIVGKRKWIEFIVWYNDLQLRKKGFRVFKFSYRISKEHKQEAQCAQKGGVERMLVFVICDFIKNFIPNPYFMFQILHEKSFKMRHVMFLYFNFSVRYS